MKLFSLRLTTLKSKLYAIVFASFVLRIVAFFLLPDSQSYAPDERTYASAVDWMLRNNPLRAFSDYGQSLFLQSRPLLYPAAFIGEFGVNPVDSVRALSSLYGFLSLYLLVKILLNFYQNTPQKLTSKIPLLVLIYALIPSHFLWSILGLRESATEFYCLLSFYALKKFSEEEKIKAKLLYFVTMNFSVAVLFTVRRPVGLVFAAALFIYFVFLSNSMSKFLLLMSLVVSSFVGYSATADFWKSGNYIFEAHSINDSSNENKSKATTEDERVASYICLSPGDIVTYHSMKFICKPVSDRLKLTNRINPVRVIGGQVSSIQSNHKANQVGAASVIRTISCPIEVNNQIESMFCIGWRSPYTTFTFLFRPIVFIDSTSKASLFAGVENLFWLLMALYISIMTIRNRKLNLAKPMYAALFYLILYVTFGGAYEGNMGTGFRHKSLILWVVILLLASTIVASQQRKAEREGISGPLKE